MVNSGLWVLSATAKARDVTKLYPGECTGQGMGIASIYMNCTLVLVFRTWQGS